MRIKLKASWTGGLANNAVVPFKIDDPAAPNFKFTQDEVPLWAIHSGSLSTSSATVHLGWSSGPTTAPTSDTYKMTKITGAQLAAKAVSTVFEAQQNTVGGSLPPDRPIVCPYNISTGRPYMVLQNRSGNSITSGTVYLVLTYTKIR